MKKYNLPLRNKRVITGIGVSTACLILIAVSVLIFTKCSANSDPDPDIILHGMLLSSGTEWCKGISLEELKSNKSYSVYLPPTSTGGYEFSCASWAPKSKILRLEFLDSMYNAFHANIWFRCKSDQLQTVDVNDESRYDVTKSKLPENSEVSSSADLTCPLFNASELTPNVIKRRRQTSIDDISKMEKISYRFAVKTGDKRIDIFARSSIDDLTANDVYTFVRSIPAVKDLMK